MSDFEKQEEIPLEFPQVPKSDNRTTGMMTILFDDWLMNYSSPYKFVVETPKWRKIQVKLGLGDYGGTFKPEGLLEAIDKLVSSIEFQSLSDIGDMASVYAKITHVDSAMKILQSLKKIAEVAQTAGVSIRAVNSQTI